MNTPAGRLSISHLLMPLAVGLWLLACGPAARAQGQAPPPPTGLGYTIDTPPPGSPHRTITLTWAASPGADYYYVEGKGLTPTGHWYSFGDTVSATSEHVSFCANVNTPGYYRLTACNQHGASTSAPLRFFLPLPAPALSVKVTGGTAHLSWAQDANADYYVGQPDQTGRPRPMIEPGPSTSLLGTSDHRSLIGTKVLS